MNMETTYLLNVGTGNDISIKELATLIKDLTDLKAGFIGIKQNSDGTYQNFWRIIIK